MAEKTVEHSDRDYRRLRVFNGVMSCFHLIQGLLILFLSNDFTLPLTTTFLSPSGGAGPMPVLPTYNEVAMVRIGPLVAVFLFISAFAHLMLTLPGIYEWYVKNLKKHVNYARWIEYFFSSSLMIVLIALLCGMYDLPSLIMIFFLNGMMILFGYMMELHNQTTEKTNWTSFYFGCLAGIVPWGVLAWYFFSAAAAGEGAMPAFVYFIFFTLFVFFNCFAVNMVLQYRKVGPWKDYLYGEEVYILLSLIAKSALAWQIFGGTLRPH